MTVVLVVGLLIPCQEEGGTRSLLLVLIGEHREQDPLDTGPITEDAHRTSAPANLPELPFNGVGGSDSLALFRILEQEEVEQFLDVPTQASHRLGVARAPDFSEEQYPF
jgi:hypothetical protein